MKSDNASKGLNADLAQIPNPVQDHAVFYRCVIRSIQMVNINSTTMHEAFLCQNQTCFVMYMHMQEVYTKSEKKLLPRTCSGAVIDYGIYLDSGDRKECPAEDEIMGGTCRRRK